MGTYPSIGNVARLSCTFTNQAGALADPTTITVQIRPPVDSIITATPTRLSTGVYYYDLLLTTPGSWSYRFIGTGAVIAQTGDGAIYVPESF